MLQLSSCSVGVPLGSTPGGTPIVEGTGDVPLDRVHILSSRVCHRVGFMAPAVYDRPQFLCLQHVQSPAGQDTDRMFTCWTPLLAVV